jgi:hypothetical protein
MGSRMLNRLAQFPRPRLAPVSTLIACLALVCAAPADAADPNPGVNQPDHVAWQLFAATVQYRASGGNNDALFETWASDADTFGAAPSWPAAGSAAKPLTTSRLGRDIRVHRTGSAALAAIADCVAGWRPGAAPCIGEEVRRNRASFDYIIQNGLYTQAGLAAYFGKGLSFPIGAVEVKADWIPVDELQSWNGTPPDQADRLYHVNTVTGPGGKPVSYALVALHLVSKTMPSWSWATFEHWKNPARCDEIGCQDLYGAAIAHVLPNARPGQGYPDCAKSSALLEEFIEAGLSPVWQNYCLKGTQASYVTGIGTPILLGSSVIEGLNAGVPLAQSSCMTCHATAAFNAKGAALTIGLDADQAGAPQPGWFGSGATAFQQADFVWAIPLCAVPTGGKSPCGG